MKTILIAAVLLISTNALYAGDIVSITDGLSLKLYAALAEKRVAGRAITDVEGYLFEAGSGFIDGYISASLLAQEVKLEMPFKLPDNITQFQAILVVNKYLSNHPEKLSEGANVVVPTALMEAFPNPNFKKLPKP